MYSVINFISFFNEVYSYIYEKLIHKYYSIHISFENIFGDDLIKLKIEAKSKKSGKFKIKSTIINTMELNMGISPDDMLYALIDSIVGELLNDN